MINKFRESLYITPALRKSSSSDRKHLIGYSGIAALQQFVTTHPQAASWQSCVEVLQNEQTLSKIISSPSSSSSSSSSSSFSKVIAGYSLAKNDHPNMITNWFRPRFEPNQNAKQKMYSTSSSSSVSSVSSSESRKKMPDLQRRFASTMMSPRVREFFLRDVLMMAAQNNNNNNNNNSNNNKSIESSSLQSLSSSSSSCADRLDLMLYLYETAVRGKQFDHHHAAATSANFSFSQVMSGTSLIRDKELAQNIEQLIDKRILLQTNVLQTKQNKNKNISEIKTNQNKKKDEPKKPTLPSWKSLLEQLGGSEQVRDILMMKPYHQHRQKTASSSSSVSDDPEASLLFEIVVTDLRADIIKTLITIQEFDTLFKILSNLTSFPPINDNDDGMRTRLLSPPLIRRAVSKLGNTRATPNLAHSSSASSSPSPQQLHSQICHMMEIVNRTRTNVIEHFHFPHFQIITSNVDLGADTADDTDEYFTHELLRIAKHKVILREHAQNGHNNNNNNNISHKNIDLFSGKDNKTNNNNNNNQDLPIKDPHIELDKEMLFKLLVHPSSLSTTSSSSSSSSSLVPCDPSIYSATKKRISIPDFDRLIQTTLTESSHGVGAVQNQNSSINSKTKRVRHVKSSEHLARWIHALAVMEHGSIAVSARLNSLTGVTATPTTTTMTNDGSVNNQQSSSSLSPSLMWIEALKALASYQHNQHIKPSSVSENPTAASRREHIARALIMCNAAGQWRASMQLIHMLVDQQLQQQQNQNQKSNPSSITAAASETTTRTATASNTTIITQQVVDAATFSLLSSRMWFASLDVLSICRQGETLSSKNAHDIVKTALISLRWEYAFRMMMDVFPSHIVASPRLASSIYDIAKLSPRSVWHSCLEALSKKKKQFLHANSVVVSRKGTTADEQNDEGIDHDHDDGDERTNIPSPAAVTAWLQLNLQQNKPESIFNCLEILKQRQAHVRTEIATHKMRNNNANNKADADRRTSSPFPVERARAFVSYTPDFAALAKKAPNSSVADRLLKQNDYPVDHAASSSSSSSSSASYSILLNALLRENINRIDDSQHRRAVKLIEEYPLFSNPASITSSFSFTTHHRDAAFISFFPLLLQIAKKLSLQRHLAASVEKALMSQTEPFSTWSYEMTKKQRYHVVSSDEWCMMVLSHLHSGNVKRLIVSGDDGINNISVSGNKRSSTGTNINNAVFHLLSVNRIDSPLLDPNTDIDDEIEFPARQEEQQQHQHHLHGDNNNSFSSSLKRRLTLRFSSSSSSSLSFTKKCPSLMNLTLHSIFEAANSGMLTNILVSQNSNDHSNIGDSMTANDDNVDATATPMTTNRSNIRIEKRVVDITAITIDLPLTEDFLFQLAKTRDAFLFVQNERSIEMSENEADDGERERNREEDENFFENSNRPAASGMGKTVAQIKRILLRRELQTRFIQEIILPFINFGGSTLDQRQADWVKNLSNVFVLVVGTTSASMNAESEMKQQREGFDADREFFLRFEWENSILLSSNRLPLLTSFPSSSSSSPYLVFTKPFNSSTDHCIAQLRMMKTMNQKHFHQQQQQQQQQNDRTKSVVGVLRSRSLLSPFCSGYSLPADAAGLAVLIAPSLAHRRNAYDKQGREVVAVVSSEKSKNTAISSVEVLVGLSFDAATREDRMFLKDNFIRKMTVANFSMMIKSDDDDEAVGAGVSKRRRTSVPVNKKGTLPKNFITLSSSEVVAINMRVIDWIDDDEQGFSIVEKYCSGRRMSSSLSSNKSDHDESKTPSFSLISPSMRRMTFVARIEIKTNPHQLVTYHLLDNLVSALAREQLVVVSKESYVVVGVTVGEDKVSLM